MTPLLTCLAFCLILTGWASFYSNLFKCELRYGYFNASAFCSLISLIGFFLCIPQWTAAFLLSVGGLLFIGFCFNLRGLTAEDQQQKIHTLACFLSLSVICFILAYGSKFRAIDDYSYWGLISKYLYTFQELPHNNHFVSSSFLTYIPALASFHYLLYTLGQQYAQLLGYFAQALVFVSALMILFDWQQKLTSLLFMSVLYLLFCFAYGTITLRMEVDGYVAVYLFAVTWLIVKPKKENLLLIAIPILFLSVIKEIGLFFALGTLVLFALVRPIKAKNIVLLLCLAAAILLLKSVWKLHVVHYGFQSFSQGISLNAALSALNPFNEFYHNAQTLFLKAILFSNFDHLIKVPYLLLYLFMAAVWYVVGRHQTNEESYFNRLMYFFIAISFIYLIMLYLLQAITFDVGHRSAVILDFTRYYNMLFLPWFVMVIFTGLELKLRSGDIALKPAAITLSVVVCLFLILGKIERVHKFYQPDGIYLAANLIEDRAGEIVERDWSVCLSQQPEPAYQSGMPLTYFFMPHRVYYNQAQQPQCDINLSWVGGKPALIDGSDLPS